MNHEIKKLSSALAASKKRAEKAEGEVAILQNAASSTLTKNNDDDVAVVEKLRARAKRAERKLNDMEDEHQSELDDLNAELKKLKAELRKAKKSATEPSTSNALSPSRIPKPSPGANALERRLEVAKNRILVLESENKMLMANGGSVSNEDSDSVEKLSQRAETAERMVQYLEKEKAALAEKAKLEIESLQSALQRQAAGVPIAITALERKLGAIEQRRRERELELQRVVNDITQRHHSEQMVLQRKMDIALQEKDIQIQRFRMELDTLLRAARQVKMRSSMSAVRKSGNVAQVPGDAVKTNVWIRVIAMEPSMST